MPSAPFVQKLLDAAHRNQSWLCVGLDPDPDLLPEPLQGLRSDPEQWIVALNRGIIEATSGLVCCYKPNLGFYEAFGEPGMRALRQTLRLIPAHIPVIADAKRNDIPNTARHYARALFEELGCDAATVNGYLGGDSLAPFFAYPDRGVFVLCKTSNAGAVDLEDLPVQTADGQTQPLFAHVARLAAEWDQHGTLGLVVGATYPADAALVRSIAPHAPFLVPGVGAQGGAVVDLVRAFQSGPASALVAASRSIDYAYRDTGGDYREAAGAEAARLKREIWAASGW